MTSAAGATYTYNVQNLRISKIVGNKTINFTLIGDKVYSGGTDYNCLWGLELVSNGSAYYLYNAHGDVIQLLNSSGAVTKTYDYDAYGNELTRDQNDPNPFRYCGEYYDTETGFIYLRARYYNPNTGRFISVDPVKDGINWYAYCGNNPVAYADPWGLKLRDLSSQATVMNYDDVGGAATTAPAKAEAALNKKYNLELQRNQNCTSTSNSAPSTKHNPGSVLEKPKTNTELEKPGTNGSDVKELMNGCKRIASMGLSDEYRGSLYDSIVDCTKNARPPKGMNSKGWRKQQKSSLENIDDLCGPSSKYAKFSKAVSVAGYVMDGYDIIRNDIIGNISNGETDWREIGSDVCIDAGMDLCDYAFVAAVTKAGAAVGGIFFPAGGQIIGALAGLCVGMIIDGLIEEYDVRQVIDDYFEFD